MRHGSCPLSTNGGFGLELSGLLGSRERPVSAHLPPCRLSRRRSAPPTDSGSSDLAAPCPRLCKNDSAGQLGATLIQTIHCARIKDSRTARSRFYCCVMTTAPSVFTQPGPFSVIAAGTKRRRGRVEGGHSTVWTPKRILPNVPCRDRVDWDFRAGLMHTKMNPFSRLLVLPAKARIPSPSAQAVPPVQARSRLWTPLSRG